MPLAKMVGGVDNMLLLVGGALAISIVLLMTYVTVRVLRGHDLWG